MLFVDCAFSVVFLIVFAFSVVFESSLILSLRFDPLDDSDERDFTFLLWFVVDRLSSVLRDQER